ncbi:oligogalacturonide lyase [Mucilaginibacter yixingensis]|uniref:Oligogalacturonide lyase n=1 Tax=Mucilaginibacter yixingensis TaxID=1295612 RepID=A0A2T5J5R7_9SPHI|nr:PD40 domain-containing protein [Mucilaginibacter yixingensis]PTQ93560.1 oligogalacturonide lyase [Mucilaginibacter yixingensis]
MKKTLLAAAMLGSVAAFSLNAQAQIGRRFPSEKKIVKDPVTGTMLTFLTSTPAGDSKIYQTHPQWTSDGQWVVFRSDRARNEAFAVNEKNGDIVQITEGGYTGMLCLARKSMKLYYLRYVPGQEPEEQNAGRGRGTALQLVEDDLGKLLADSKAGKMQPASAYLRVCGTIPASMTPGNDMALDADEQVVYCRVGHDEAAKHLAPNTKVEANFGPRNMGAGPAGLISMDIKTGNIKYIVSVPFQIGHVQTNPWVPGEIVFCWETGGKSPQRTWTVMADGTGLRPLYPEAPFEWVTHEAVITKDEVAIAIMGHRKVNPAEDKPFDAVTNPGVQAGWGSSGTREKPTGLGIVNLRTREMVIIGQTPKGSGLWHVNGSGDGRWAVGDDFSRSIYLIDRHTREMIMLSTGHKETATDHPHPTFSPDGTRIEIESAMLSADNKSMNICIIPVPESWLKRRYKD